MWQIRDYIHIPRARCVVLSLVLLLTICILYFRSPSHLSNLSRLNPSILSPQSPPSSFASDHNTPYSATTKTQKAASSPISTPSDHTEAPKYHSSSVHNNNKHKAPPPSRFAVVKLEPSGDIKQYGLIQTLDSAAISPKFTTISYNQLVFWNTWCHSIQPVISKDPMQCWSIWMKVYLETKDFQGTDCKKEKALHLKAQEAMVKLWSYPYLKAMDTDIAAETLPEFYKKIGECLADKTFKKYVVDLAEKPRSFFTQAMNFYVSGSPYIIFCGLLMFFFYHWTRDVMIAELQENYYKKGYCYVCGQGWEGRTAPAPSWWTYRNY